MKSNSFFSVFKGLIDYQQPVMSSYIVTDLQLNNFHVQKTQLLILYKYDNSNHATKCDYCLVPEEHVQ